MKKILLILFILCAMLFGDQITTQNSVVKIFASIALPDYKYPYQTSKISQFSGSGAIIDNN